MKLFTLASLLAFSLIALPSLASAQTPEPVRDAYEALYSDRAYKTTFTSDSSMEIIGVKIITKVNGSGYQDSNGNLEATITTTLSDPSTKKKFSLPIELRYFSADDAVYFRIKKLPKDLSSGFSELKANVWYQKDGGDKVASLMGQGEFYGEHFLNANEKYPAVRFIEKGSTKKEHVYAVSVNREMLPDFLEETARLNGKESTSVMSFVEELLATTKGTFYVDKVSLLPKKVTIKQSKKPFLSQTEATYTFGGTKKVERPKGAIKSDVASGAIGI
ncbi:MAG: hypothetical protein V4682_03935 [Patescibacteria group bacterium]